MQTAEGAEPARDSAFPSAPEPAGQDNNTYSGGPTPAGSSIASPLRLEAEPPRLPGTRTTSTGAVGSHWAGASISAITWRGSSSTSF